MDREEKILEVRGKWNKNWNFLEYICGWNF